MCMLLRIGADGFGHAPQVADDGDKIGARHLDPGIPGCAARAG
jgi:hypothetical protein